MKTYMRISIMQQIGISDIQRNLHKLKDFDIVEIIDKKRGKIRGYFLDEKYAQAVQVLIEQQNKSKNRANELAGSLRAYANPSLLKQEKSAWQVHIKEQYQP